MSIAAMNWAWSIEGLNPTERLTLLSLADNASDDGYCFPGQNRIAERVCVSKRTVIRMLEALEDRGLLAREVRVLASGARTSNGYRLDLWGAVTDCHPPSDTTVMAPVTTVSPIENHQENPSTDVEVKARARATRIAEPFLVTADMKGWAADEGIPPELVLSETRKFVDYWRGRSGAISLKLDWPATWRNWMRRAAEDRAPAAPARSRYSKPTPTERAEAALASMLGPAAGLPTRGELER